MGIACLCALGPEPARAEDSVAEVTPTGSQPTSAAEVPMVWHVWPLFDPFVDRHERVLSFGSQSRRLTGEHSATDGWYLAFAQSVTTQRAHVFVTVQQGLRLRRNDGGAYAFDLMAFSYFGGVRFGPLELAAGVNLVPLTIDYERAWDVGGLSPGASLQVSAVLGRLWLGVRGFEQYSQRWTAEQDAIVQGVGIELGWVLPQVTRRGRHPLVFVYD